MSVSASEEHAISFFKALLEIVSLKFIHFIIIQVTGMANLLAEMLIWNKWLHDIWAKPHKTNWIHKKSEKERKFFMLYSADVILRWHLVLWELIVFSCVFKFLYHEKSHFCDRCNFSRLIPLQPGMLLDLLLWLMSTD